VRGKLWLGLFGLATATSWLLAVLLLAPPAAFAQESEDSAPPAEESAEVSSSADAESEALEKALSAPPTDPQALLNNLEEFLKEFPESSRREQILRSIFKLAMQSNDPRRAAAAAEQLLEDAPDDPEMLTVLVDLYLRLPDEASRAKALEFGNRFVERAERHSGEDPVEGETSAQREETSAMLRATAYFMRGRVHMKTGADDKAVADLERSLELYPTAQVADQLGDAAMKTGDLDRAVDAYLTAFAFPDRIEPSRRDQFRKKLGSAWVAKHESEEGLGERVLARYDELVRRLEPRLASGSSSASASADLYDYEFERLEGGQTPLSAYRGKVVVMDFWATWCAPCRLEGPLFHRVREKFQDEGRAVFLLVNLDEDRSGVPEFVEEEGWTLPVVYGQGLDRILGVRALPTVIILDAEGRVIFRKVGLDLATFVPTLEAKVRDALAQMPATTAAK
jgi:thiol-disulfide isomerase/thioredoxin